MTRFGCSNFWNYFFKESNIQGMSEAQEFLTIPSSLEGLALKQYESGVGVATCKDGKIFSWLYIIQYLARSYA